MKTTRMIAGVALAGLLVIGPVTMTQAHEKPKWPGQLDFPQMTTNFAEAAESGNMLAVDLKAEGLSASALGEALQTSSDDLGTFEIKRVGELTDYIVIVVPGASSAPLIQIDVADRWHVFGHLRPFLYDGQGGVIYCPKGRDAKPTVVTSSDFEAGMDPLSQVDAAMAGAMVLAAGGQL